MPKNLHHKTKDNKNKNTIHQLSSPFRKGRSGGVIFAVFINIYRNLPTRSQVFYPYRDLFFFIPAGCNLDRNFHRLIVNL